MNLRHLKVLTAVVDAGSIRAAARASALTQPALSYAIRELEQSVGAQLLLRSASGVVLTEIGQALYRRSKLISSEVRRAEEEIAQMRDRAGGRVCVAFSSSAVERFLADALLAFRREWPGVKLELHELSGALSKDLWSRGDFDFAVVGELVSETHDDVDRDVLLEFPLRVLAKNGHPLARERSLSKLHDASWVVPPYGAQLLRQHFEAFEQAPPPNIVICHSMQLGMTLVRKASALTLVGQPFLDRPASMRGLTGLKIADRLPNLQVSLLIRDRASLTPAARSFSAAFKAASRAATTVA